MTIISPCIGVCIAGADGVCEGCCRSLDEIARWSLASDLEKQQILDAAITRSCRADPAISAKLAFGHGGDGV